MKPGKYPVFNFKEVSVWLLDIDDMKYLALHVTLVTCYQCPVEISTVFIFLGKLIPDHKATFVRISGCGSDLNWAAVPVS